MQPRDLAQIFVGRSAARFVNNAPLTPPLSDLLRRVLGCLRDHPHDDTPARVTRRLGLVTPDAVEAALAALEHDRLVMHAGEHWSPTRTGWKAARAENPFADT